MVSTEPVDKRAQAGFTLIELIVVIVILGILAATALPRMFDMSGQARIAKMQAALGAMKAANSGIHATWLVNGGLLGCFNCTPSGAVQLATVVKAEGVEIMTMGGYPDVGGDGFLNTATSTANSGMFKAANLDVTDFVISTNDPALAAATPTVNQLVVAADAAHPTCRFVFKEATQTGGAANVPPTVGVPEFTSSDLNATNCG